MKDLRINKRESRKKPGMREFFILLLVYSYYNKSQINNEFSIPQTVLADYFICKPLTIKRWFKKLREINCIQLAERPNAGQTGYYKIKENGKLVKKEYIIPKYKKIRCGNNNELKFLNVYILDQQKLNQYLIDHIELDILDNIKDYKIQFNQFIRFLKRRSQNIMFLNSLQDIEYDDLNNIIDSNISNKDKNQIKRYINIQNKIVENIYYLDKKEKLDKVFPDFKCKYLKENCLRLTHELCNTINPEHIDKIDESNYWRSSHVRYDMLHDLLNTTKDDKIVEYDINGSIYRLTYNLYHNELLDRNIDIYELIWNACNFNINWLDYAKYRNAFKMILMPIYMKEYTIAYRASQYEYIKKYYASDKSKYNELNKVQKEFYEQHKLFVDLLQINIKEFLIIVRDAMHKVITNNKFIGPDIFIHESNLHILVREKYMNKGIKCVNIYDGFYFKQQDTSSDEFYTIYNESLLEIKSNLNNGIGTSII